MTIHQLSADETAAWYGESAPAGFDPRSLRVRFSNLKAMGQSPAHYLEAVKRERADSASMRLGRAVHAMVLGTSYVTFDGTRRGKAWDDFRRDHAGQEIFAGAEVAQARAIAHAVESHEAAAELLAGCVREKELRWTHELNRACQSTLDGFNDRRVVELKTTRCSDPGRFVRDAQWRHYHAQLAWYLDAVRQSGLGTPSEAYVIAVESTRPYPVTVLRLTDRAIDMGRRMCRLWLERLLVCEGLNRWPGYVESVVDFDVDDGEGLTLQLDGEEVEF